jgi:neutral ceramidase
MSAQLLVGSAETIITPPVGTPLAGYFAPRTSTGVISDLRAKAFVAGDGEEGVGIVACDLLGLDREAVAQARAIVQERTGLRGERLMICCTHTHTGPETGPYQRIVPRNEEWAAALPGMIADAVAAAWESRRPGVLHVGKGHEEGLAFNRRFRMRDGREEFGPRGDETVGPAGPTDPQLGVICAADEDNSPFAMIVNYSLHIDVTGGNLISADWPAVLTETVQAVYGPKVIVLFVQGACGNINHCDYFGTPYPAGGGISKSRQIGRALGAAAVNVNEKARPSESQTVDAAREVLDAPYFPQDEVLQWRLEQARSAPEPSFFDKALLEWVDDYPREGAYPLEVQALRFGDAAIAGAPGELFVEWGLEIKKWSPHKVTLVAELANDSIGYIPTWEAIRRGGYESTPVVSVRLSPATGQLVADTNFRLLQELYRLRDGAQ